MLIRALLTVMFQTKIISTAIQINRFTKYMHFMKFVNK